MEFLQFLKLAGEVGMTPALAVLGWIGWGVMRSQRELSTLRTELAEIIHALDKRVARLEWAAEKRGAPEWHQSAKH